MVAYFYLLVDHSEYKSGAHTYCNKFLNDFLSFLIAH